MFRTLHSRRGSAATVVVVLLVLALIAGGLWYFVLRSTPEKTVTALLEAARVDDRELMNDYLTDRSIDGAPLVTSLTTRLAGRGAGEPDYSIGEAEINGNRALVPVQFPLGDTISAIAGVDSFTMPYVLHREGRTWLVDAPDTQEELARQAAGGLLDAFRRFVLPGGPPGNGGESQS